jgi:hypothetical protein
VLAPQALQESIVERLDAERQPGHPGRPEGGQAAGFEVLGIGLEGDLGVGPEPEAVARRRDQLADGVGRQERGRPAPEEEADGGQPAGPGKRRVAGQLVGERGNEGSDPVLAVDGDVEVAVRAAPEAEQTVDVDPVPLAAGSRLQLGNRRTFSLDDRRHRTAGGGGESRARVLGGPRP